MRECPYPHPTSKLSSGSTLFLMILPAFLKKKVNDPAAELRGIKYKKDSLRFPSPHPSPQRGEGKGEGADSGEKNC